MTSVAFKPEPRREPAADEVRHDAEELVEEEQRRDLERAVAALVEVEEHEHPDRPVGDRVRPVGARDDAVVAKVDARGAHLAVDAGPGHDDARLSYRRSSI
jgi:hypothetical protein